MTVVNLSDCKDLLNQWAQMRALIVSGQVQGLAVCVTDGCGGERVFFAGSYRDQPDAALRAALSISWELTKLRSTSG